eukprot:UN01126
MRLSAVVLFFLAVVVSLSFAKFNLRQRLQRDIILKDDNAAGDSVLSLCRCKGSTTWTLHGVWPDGKSFCTKEKYDEKQIKPIWNELLQYWPACPEFGNTQSWFLEHEWEKHGTCAKNNGHNVTQIEYFTLGLQLRDEYHTLCSPDLTGECRIKLDSNYNPKRITEYDYVAHDQY